MSKKTKVLSILIGICIVLASVSISVFANSPPKRDGVINAETYSITHDSQKSYVKNVCLTDNKSTLETEPCTIIVADNKKETTAITSSDEVVKNDVLTKTSNLKTVSKENKPNENVTKKVPEVTSELAVVKETTSAKPNEKSTEATTVTVPQKAVMARNLEPGLNIDESTFIIPEKTETRGRNIIVSGYGTVKFKASQLEQKCPLKNSSENPCYFVYIVELDTGEKLFESGLIPPGYTLEKFTINRYLDPGNYRIVFRIRTYSFDIEQRQLNNAVIKTDLVVE